MNVSGQSPETVKVHLTNRAAHYKLTLKERHAGNEVIMGDEIGLKAEIGGKLEQAVQSQNGWFWPAACFHRTHLQLDLASFSEDKLNQVLQHLHVTDPSRMKASKNAGVSLKRTSGEYTVTKEYYGTELRPAAFKQLVRHALSELSSSVDLDGGGAYRDPDYTSESDAVKKAAKTMNRMTDFSVTYQMTGIEPVKVDRDQIRKWLRLDQKRNVVVNKKGIAAFTRRFAKKYNTCYTSRRFKTTGGKTITTTDGYYGWMLNQIKENARLAKEVKAGKDVNRSPIWAQTAVSHNPKCDYGNTYVEVSIADQMVWYYKNGKRILTTDCVTGDTTQNHGTTPGVYQIEYKQRHATLSRQGYSSPVSYWMPFNSDQGLHDASWRYAFGGSIYQGDGSHGCVNLPVESAKTLYRNIKKGCPVFVY